jgi:hypothetical protein
MITNRAEITTALMCSFAPNLCSFLCTLNEKKSSETPDPGAGHLTEGAHSGAVATLINTIKRR